MTQAVEKQLGYTPELICPRTIIGCDMTQREYSGELPHLRIMSRLFRPIVVAV